MKKIFSIIFAFCMLFTSVYAENSITCNYLTDENRVTISAQFQGLGAHIFSVICAKIPLDTQNITLDTMLQNEDSIVYYNHKATDTLGNISDAFTIRENAQNGTYTVLITDGKNSISTTFYRFDEEAVENSLEELNKITDYETFKTEFFKMFYGGELPVESNLYKLSDEKEEHIAKYLFDNKIFECVEDFEKKYVEALVLSISSNPQNYSDIKEVIEKFPECGITFSDDYKNLKDKSAVFKLLIGDKFSTIAELQDAIDVAVKERVEAENAVLPSVGGSSSSDKKPFGSTGGGGGSASVKPPTVQNVEFTDLQDVSWAKSAIYNLRDKGVIAGYGDNTFAPNKSVSRFEFVKMLVSAFKLQVNTDLIPFTDISDEHWCKNYVASAYKLGIIKGLTQQEFKGDNFITREDMSVMMCRLAELIGVNMQKAENALVSDIDSASAYAKESVEKCIGSGLMIGSDGKFSPKEETTRAQCAVVIDRFTEMAGEVK